MKEIYWTVYFSVRSGQKAQRLADEFANKMNGVAKIVACSQYWKDESKYCVEITEILRSRDSCDLVIEIFESIQIVASTWQIDLPLDISSANMSGVVAEGIKITGMSWASFMVQDVNEPIPIDIALR